MSYTAIPAQRSPALLSVVDGNARACFTVHVPDLDALCSEFAGRGISAVNGPVNRPWGPRAAYFADPGGYVYEFVQIPAEHQG